MYLAEKMHRLDISQMLREISHVDMQIWEAWYRLGGNYLDDLRHGQVMSAIYGSQGIKCKPAEFMRSETGKPTVILGTMRIG